MEEEEEEEVMFVTLHDGRRLAYREQGVTANDRVVQKSLLVLHGTPSSRLAGMPGNQTNKQTKLSCKLSFCTTTSSSSSMVFVFPSNFSLGSTKPNLLEIPIY
jgi:hypothetical protein